MQEHPSEEPTEHTTDTDGTGAVGADLSSFTLTDNENPIFITGDDGTVYQVAGQNEQGQTILLTQGKTYFNYLICLLPKSNYFLNSLFQQCMILYTKHLSKYLI